MRLGGAILAVVAIIWIVLIANNRWDNVWAAMLGAGSPAPSPTLGFPSGYGGGNPYPGSSAGQTRYGP